MEHESASERIDVDHGIDPEPLLSTFYHVAIIVEDLDKAMEEFSAGLGVHWGEVRDGALGPWTYRLTFSYEGPPHIELIEGQPGSPWDTSSGPRPDHIGYWTDDIEEGKRRLIARGLPIDFDACPYGSPFSDHRAAHTGLRLELVDVSRRPWFLATYHKPDGDDASAPADAVER